MCLFDRQMYDYMKKAVKYITLEFQRKLGIDKSGGH